MLLQRPLVHAAGCRVTKTSDTRALRSQSRVERSRLQTITRCGSAVKDLLEEPVVQVTTLISDLTDCTSVREDV